MFKFNLFFSVVLIFKINIKGSIIDKLKDISKVTQVQSQMINTSTDINTSYQQRVYDLIYGQNQENMTLNSYLMMSVNLKLNGTDYDSILGLNKENYLQSLLSGVILKFCLDIELCYFTNKSKEGQVEQAIKYWRDKYIQSKSNRTINGSKLLRSQMHSNALEGITLPVSFFNNHYWQIIFQNIQVNFIYTENNKGHQSVYNNLIFNNQLIESIGSNKKCQIGLNNLQINDTQLKEVLNCQVGQLFQQSLWDNQLDINQNKVIDQQNSFQLMNSSFSNVQQPLANISNYQNNANDCPFIKEFIYHSIIFQNDDQHQRQTIFIKGFKYCLETNQKIRLLKNLILLIKEKKANANIYISSIETSWWEIIMLLYDLNYKQKLLLLTQKQLELSLIQLQAINKEIQKSIDEFKESKNQVQYFKRTQCQQEGVRSSNYQETLYNNQRIIKKLLNLFYFNKEFRERKQQLENKKQEIQNQFKQIVIVLNKKAKQTLLNIFQIDTNQTIKELH